jgi:hypothetical protein
MDDLWHGVYVLAWKVPDGFVQTSEAKKGKRERKSLEALGPGCHDLYLFHLIMTRAEWVFPLL